MHTHFFFFHYVLSVFPHHQLLGLLLSKNGHGIFNMHNHLQNVCWAHKGVTGTGDSAQVLTEKNWKSVFHPSHPNPWLLDLQPKASASQPQTPTGLHTVHKLLSSSFHCLNPCPESQPIRVINNNKNADCNVPNPIWRRQYKARRWYRAIVKEGQTSITHKPKKGEIKATNTQKARQHFHLQTPVACFIDIYNLLFFFFFSFFLFLFS